MPLVFGIHYSGGIRLREFVGPTWTTRGMCWVIGIASWVSSVIVVLEEVVDVWMAQLVACYWSIFLHFCIVIVNYAYACEFFAPMFEFSVCSYPPPKLPLQRHFVVYIYILIY